MDLIEEVVGELAVRYLLPALIDKVTGRPERAARGVPRSAARRDSHRAVLRMVDPASMPTDRRIVSDTPGRLRVGVPAVRGNRELAAIVVAALAAGPGVHEVTASDRTGSVLIYYDAARVVASDLLAAIDRATEFPRRQALSAGKTRPAAKLALVGG